MSEAQEKHDIAEALYKAIRHEVEKINEYTTFRERRLANVPFLRAIAGSRIPQALETLARAFSTVANSSVPDNHASFHLPPKYASITTAAAPPSRSCER